MDPFAIRRRGAIMKRSVWISIVIAAVVLFYFTRSFHSGGSDTIEYQGERFKMAKSYWSYEDYKDDPNNLDTNELSRIEAVMVETSIGTLFDTREQFVHAAFHLKFPGYGLEEFGEKPQSDGSGLSMFSIEIPQRAKDRYLVARITGGRYTLVDDFVACTTSNVVSKVELEGMSLRYYDAKGLLIREHQISQ